MTKGLEMFPLTFQTNSNLNTNRLTVGFGLPEHPLKTTTTKTRTKHRRENPTPVRVTTTQHPKKIWGNERLTDKETTLRTLHLGGF